MHICVCDKVSHMAQFMESIFLVLLAFCCGSFLTWTMTMYTVQQYESYVLEKQVDKLNSGFLRSGPLGIASSNGTGYYRHHRESNFITNATRRRLSPGPAAARLVSPHDRHNKSYPKSNNTNKTRVLCWVMTSPDTLHTRANGIKETWGPRCDVTLYMSSKADPNFPAVGLPVNEGRDGLWNKTREALLYIYEHHLDDADWFMKADDDTYVIVDNLRSFLRDKNSSEPVYYGHQYNVILRRGYMSGGAGYVISKEALKRLVVDQLQRHINCEVSRGKMKLVEDLMIGWCLDHAGVLAGDSRDERNRSRFLPLNTKDYFNNGLPEWFFKYSKYSVKPGRDCCSDSLISIHYVREPDAMLLLDYYIHGIKLKT